MQTLLARMPRFFRTDIVPSASTADLGKRAMPADAAGSFDGNHAQGQ
jgi:hypothetical protein